MTGTRRHSAAALSRRLGRVLAWWGWPVLAVQAFRDAIGSEPGSAEAHVGLGEALRGQGRWAEAAAVFAEAARLRPADAEIQARLVAALGRAGLSRPALEALQRLIRLRPGEAEMHVLRGALLMRLRRRAEAIRAFRWAVRLPPSPCWRRSFLGEATLGERQWLAIAQSYRGALVAPVPAAPLATAPPLAPTPSLPARAAAAIGWGTFVFGRLLAGRRGPASAAWALREMRRLGRPGRATAGALAALLLGAPAARAAARIVETAEARENARGCFEAVGEGAIVACRKALDLGIEPQRALLVRRSIARKLEALGRWEEGARTYAELAALRPDDPEAQLRLGLALLYSVGRPEEALGPLRAAEALRPEDTRSRLALGAALNALGRFAESTAAFEAALAIDATCLDAQPASRLVYAASQAGRVWP
jgi:superkiller protein 3